MERSLDTTIAEHQSAAIKNTITLLYTLFPLLVTN